MPLVLVHGIVSSRYLLPTARALAARHDVVAVDLPGFGDVATAPGSAASISAMAEAVAAALEREVAGASMVVGHSIGAQVAVDLAVRRSDLVGGLVLAGPTGDPRLRNVLQLWRRWIACAPREPLGFNLLVLREVLEVGPRRMLATGRAAVEDRFEEKLNMVTVPTLVVRGEHDRVTPPDWAATVQRRVGGGPVQVLPGEAHSIVYSAPGELAKVISQFADRMSGDGTGAVERSS